MVEVDGLQQKRKPVSIKRKWNHVIFSRATILLFHPVYNIIYSKLLLLISKFIKKWLGVPNSLRNVALYSSSTKLKFPTLSLVEEYKLGKVQLFQMLHDSHDPLLKNTQPSMITSRKWKAKIAVKNAESALRMKDIIGTVANGKAGLGLHPQRWWSTESTSNRRRMVSEEIHHLGEVRHFATAVEQRKQDAWTKWESAKDRPQAYGTKENKFPHKSSLQRITNTSQPSCSGVNYIWLMLSMRENCEPQTYSHWMWVHSKKLYLET